MKAKDLKRYNLVLPKELFNEVQAIADSQHSTVVELIRRFIKLGLIVAKISENPNATLILRENEHEREILLI